MGFNLKLFFEELFIQLENIELDSINAMTNEQLTQWIQDEYEYAKKCGQIT